MSGTNSWTCNCGASNSGGAACGACGNPRSRASGPAQSGARRSPLVGPAGTAVGAGLAALSVLAMGLMYRSSQQPAPGPQRPGASAAFGRLPAGYPPVGGSIATSPPAISSASVGATAEAPRRQPGADRSGPASGASSGASNEAVPPPVGLYVPPYESPLPPLTAPGGAAPVTRFEPPQAPGAPPGQSIIARTRASVLKVVSAAPTGDRRGTGFVVGPRLVLTCAHLVRSTSGVAVTLPDGRQVAAALERLDALNDLALLSTQADLPPALPIDESGRVEPGEPIAVTGFPGGAAGEAETGDFTVIGALAGWVTRSSPSGERVEMLQALADIRPGHSGGPLYSLRDGRVFGVMSFRVTGSQVTGYATGAPMVRQFLGVGPFQPTQEAVPLRN